jgi:hypothetical protein
MKKTLLLIAVLALMLIASSEPNPTIRLTIINKSGMDIAVQLRAKGRPYVNCCGTTDPKFYYLSVPSGDRETPSAKWFDIEQETYSLQVFYIETWDPVYGFKCDTPIPTALIAGRDLRLTVLPCGEIPRKPGERSMWKYIPYPITALHKRVWIARLVY